MWVWNVVRFVCGGVVGTLLGPEGSGVGPVLLGRGLVCLLVFDFWIVDASIARTSAPLLFGGGCFCVGVCFCSVCLCSIDDGAAASA